MAAHNGVQLEFIEEFCSRVGREVSNGQFHCVLLLDEMKIRKGLVFDKHKGVLYKRTSLHSSLKPCPQYLHRLKVCGSVFQNLHFYH